MAGHGWIPAGVDVQTPSAARLYDYYLGGTHNFESDRALAEKVCALIPRLPHMVRLNRYFLRRATQFCVDQGIAQFLDLGCGLPTTGAVHEIAQKTDPEARVVYVDSEPVAVAHSDLLLEGNDRAEVLHGDLRDPDQIRNHPHAATLLDFSRPVAVLMVAVLHFVPDSDGPAGLIGRYMRMLASGSYLVFSHVTADNLDNADEATELYKQSQNPIYPRSYSEVAAMLSGLDLVAPGLVNVSEWRPEHPDDAGDPDGGALYSAVAYKP